MEIINKEKEQFIEDLISKINRHYFNCNFAHRVFFDEKGKFIKEEDVIGAFYLDIVNGIYKLKIIKDSFKTKTLYQTTTTNNMIAYLVCKILKEKIIIL